MSLNVGKEIAALERVTVSELRERYEKLFNETTRAPQSHMAHPPHYLADAVVGTGRPV